MLTTQRHPGSPAGPARTVDPIPDWTKLSRADEVAVYRDAVAVAAGRIDMIAIDRSVFWIIQDGGLGRVMFCKGEGVEVFRRTSACNSNPNGHSLNV